MRLLVCAAGAERPLRLPQDLERFQELPLTVEYYAAASSTPADTAAAPPAAASASGASGSGAEQLAATRGALVKQVLQLQAFDAEAGTSEWQVANVKANLPGKGRQLSKKQREARIVIPLASIKGARVYVNF